MTLLLIGVSIYAAIITLLLIFFVVFQRNEEKELEALFKYYDYFEQVRLEKIDAEISYLETQYGVDDYKRGKREND